MRFTIIVTDVTDYGSLHCVAGWDLLSKRMVRPEPSPKEFWAEKFVGPKRVFWPGNVVEFEGEVPTGQPYPHATEDVVVTLATLRKIDTIQSELLPRAVADSVAPSADELFARELRRNGWKGFVPVNTKCGSLGAIEIDREAFKFSEDRWRDESPKLRGVIAAQKLNLSITSTVLRAAYSSKGMEAVKAMLPNQSRLHIRLGLARPFPEDQCYAQINGMYRID